MPGVRVCVAPGSTIFSWDIRPQCIAVTHTGERGFFTFIDLPPDTYFVLAEKDGKSPIALYVRISSDQTAFVFFPIFNTCSAIIGTKRWVGDGYTSMDLSASWNNPPYAVPLPTYSSASKPHATYCL